MSCAPQALGFAGLLFLVTGLLGVAGAGESATSAVPAALGRGGALVAGLALIVAASVSAHKAPHRGAALSSTLAWAWVGAIAGIGLVWLPFLLGYPVAWQYYERVT